MTAFFSKHLFTQGFSIRRSLLGLIAIPFFTVLGLMVYDTYRQYTDDIRDTYRIAEAIRSLSSTQTEHILLEGKTLLDNLSKRPLVKALDAKHCDPLLAELKALSPDYANLFTLDKDGQLVCSATPIPPTAPRGPNPSYYFNEVKRTRQFAVGKPAKGFVTKRWVSSLAYPLENAAGEFIGAVGVSIDLANYQPLVNKYSVPPNTIVGITNSDGVIIARSEDAANRVGTVSRADAAKRILNEKNGFLHANDFEGNGRYYAFAPIANTDWIAYASLDENTVLMPLLLYSIVRLAIAITLLMLLMIATTRILRRIAAPIESIYSTIASIARGNINERAPEKGPIEIRQIAQELNAMLDLRQKVNDELRQSETRYRMLTEWTAESLIVHDGTTIFYANPAAIKLLGANSLQELTSKPFIDYVHPDYLDIVKARIASRAMPLIEQKYCTLDGRTIDVEVQSTMMQFDGKERIQSALHDITARKQAEAQSAHLAFYNALTNLPNRRLLIDRLQVQLSWDKLNTHYGALLSIDLDNFKALNDTLGHKAGDGIIVEVGQRLVQNTVKEDTVAHQGGDDFFILLRDLGPDLEQAITSARKQGEKILQAIRTGFQIGDAPYRCTTSIGITIFGRENDTVDELLKQADLALYQAKAGGHNTLRFFDAKMQSAIVKQTALESAIADALLKDQFKLYYQPQIDGTGRVVGAEGLLRWQHPDFGLMGPTDFIKAAELADLILPIGNWVLETACRQLQAWQHHPHYGGMSLSVNISVRQLRQFNFTQDVLAILQSTGANPNLLKLEITENLLVDDVEDTISKMTVLRSHGVRFSLDDFGTGFSSLNYLRQLPLDQLKIDQSFIAELPENGDACSIARAIIALGQSLGLSVIAEGVETEAQRQFLFDHGCHLYQGYLFSRPVPVDEFTAYTDQTFAN